MRHKFHQSEMAGGIFIPIFKIFRKENTMNKRLEEIRSLLADETNKNLNFDELEKSIKK